MPYGNINNAKKFNYNKRFYFKSGLPLDIYKNNLVLGFSYYKLLTSYTGYCVRVRRSSDNAEMDFGFVSNYIDYVGILAFCGAGNGYVSIWYNQYSGGNNAVQDTNGNQPRIVNAGIFNSDGLYFDGVGYFLNLTYYENLYFNNFAIYFILKIPNKAAWNGLFSNASSSVGLDLLMSTTALSPPNTSYIYYSNGSGGYNKHRSNTQKPNNINYLQYYSNNLGNSIIAINDGITDSGNFNYIPSNLNISIGIAYSSTFYNSGNLKELVIFNNYINNSTLYNIRNNII
jgi:hypothetical protein